MTEFKNINLARDEYESEARDFLPQVTHGFYQYMAYNFGNEKVFEHVIEGTYQTYAVLEEYSVVGESSLFWHLTCPKHPGPHRRCICIANILTRRMDRGLHGGVVIPGRLFPIYACITYVGADGGLDAPWPNTAQVEFSLFPESTSAHHQVIEGVTSRLDTARVDLIHLLREKVDAKLATTRRSYDICKSDHHSGNRNLLARLQEDGYAYSELLWRILSPESECYTCYKARLNPEYLNQR